MDSIGAIVATIILGMLLIGGVAVAQYSMSDSVEKQPFNATFDAGGPNTTVGFSVSNQTDTYYGAQPTVTAADGSAYSPGLDYEWNSANGTLTVLDGALANTTGNNITFAYGGATARQTETADFIGTMLGVGSYLPLLLLVALLLIAVATIGGLA